MRPLIGISCRLAQDNTWSPALVGVRRGYVDAILAAGGMPVLIPPQLDQSALQAMYELLDGVLLSGGADIDPGLYGEEPHPQLGAVEPERDATELVLTRWAVADGKAVLAICRGMQMLNVALGGTLYQDLPSQYLSSFDHEAGVNQQTWRQPDHVLMLDESSRLAEVLRTATPVVNSLHHQALKDIGSTLKVVGRAPDGVVEAIEGTGEAFVVGVQCHPEELWQATDTRWQHVFRTFVDAAAYRRTNQQHDMTATLVR